MKIILFLLFLLLFAMGKAQQVISSAGASEKSATLQLSWSVGEQVIETFTAGNNILTQGFHQSKLTVTAVNIGKLPRLVISVYPNPVTTELMVEVKFAPFENLSFCLFDSDGKLLQTRKISNQVELINMENYPTGVYFLKVLHGKLDNLQTFKVMKNAL